MKKLFATLALVAFAASATAATTGFVKYDFDNASNSNFTQNEVHVGAALDTKLGKFDAAVVGRQLSPTGGVRDNAYGFEVGYSTGLKLGAVGVTGRAAAGRVNHVDANFGGFSGNTQYYSLAAEASLPVTKQVSAFAGYRFRQAFNSTGPAQNRFTVGADVALAKNIALRAGYAFTKQNGANAHGLTTAVSYQF